MRAQLVKLVSHRLFQQTITGLIIVNAIILGLETMPRVNAAIGAQLMLLDTIIVWIFVAEIALRLAAHGLRFFRDPWSVFDFLVVAISLSSMSGLSALRAFRVFRVLRMLNAFPSLRTVIAAMLRALPGVASVGVVIVIILFVASVIATKLFGESTPDLFGDLFTSMFTLFTVMTLEGWPDVARTVIAEYPYAWIFFVIFILVGTLTMLNLFVAIIVQSIGDVAASDLPELQNGQATDMARMAQEMAAMRAALDRQSDEIARLKSDLPSSPTQMS